MTLRYFLATLGAATVLAWAAVGFIVTATDPTVAPPGLLVVFYCSLFCGLTGTLALTGLGLRQLLRRRDPVVSRQVAAAFRQAALLAVLAVLALVLKSRSWLAWWNLSLAIIGLAAVELALMSRRLASR